MSEPSAYEQYALELINAQRLNPQGAAETYGASGTITATQLQPFAFNLLLNDAAEDHSEWLLQTNRFSHTGQGGSSPEDRMEDAGYQFTGDFASEANLAMSRTTGFLNPLSALEDNLEALFLNATTRARMLDPQYREIGLGYELGRYRQYNAAVLNENFAVSGDDKFITGVIYTDTNADDQFSYDEGVGGATIRIQPQGGSQEEFTNYATGGYTASTIASGLIDVEFSRNGTTVAVTIEMGVDNVKVDLRDTNFIASSASAFLGEGAVGLELLGINDTNATGNDGENIIVGNSGDNRIAGGEASDTLTGNGGSDAFVFDNCHDGVDQVTDFVSGTDTIEIGRLGFAQNMQLGLLGEDSLVFGSTATQNQAQFLYDQSTGNLSIDMDGTGIGEALLFANLGAGTALAYSDIVITAGGRTHSIVSQNIVTIETNGAYRLAVDTDGTYMMTTGAGIPVGLQFFAIPDVGPATFDGWSALQAEATSTGFTLLWEDPTGGYAVWETDNAGNYLSSYHFPETELNHVEARFAVDLDGDGKIGVIEDDGAYELSVDAAGMYQVGNGVGSPVVLKYGAAETGPRTFDGWAALHAEATATGFTVLWEDPIGGYALWETDNNGNYLSSYDFQEAEFNHVEARFAMDFNGDGGIGLIEDNGAYELSVDETGMYQISNGVGAPVVLKIGTSDIGPRTFAGWSALQAEATATGFTVLWQDPTGGYAVWDTDVTGTYQSSYDLQEAGLNNIEARFAADLNGDGGVGAIEDNGAYQLLINENGSYKISNGAGTDAVLKVDGAEISPATFEGWSALQAEATATGFTVLWEDPAGGYAVWQTDAAGTYQTSYNLLASELVEIEALFDADLDGGGGIGVVEDNGAFQLLINETGAYQVSNGAGTSAVLKIGTTEVGHATFDGWSALQAEATAGGYSVLWQDPTGGYVVWQTDAAGTYQSSTSLTASSLSEVEAVFAADLNGNGGIGLLEDNGAFQFLINETGAYQISDGAGTDAVLKVGTTEVGYATFDGWSAVQAEATDTGFAVLWQDPTGGYAVWQTDATGVFESSNGLPAASLVEVEALFAADLNGDGSIGLV